MLDIGWTELVVIAVVAILVVGPKDLPRMLRSFGQTLGQLRRSANDFKRQFDDALREAEREADFADARKSVQSIGRIDPVGDVKKDVEKGLNAAGETSKRPKPSAAKPAGDAGGTEGKATAAAKPANAAPATAEPTEGEPAKQPDARRDSDAA